MSVVAHAAGLAAAGGLLMTAPAPNVALHAPGHSPKIKTHWNYSVTVTRGGKPAAATITAQIVDPIGGVHIVQFGSTTRNIKNFPIKGVFRDYIIWPRDSNGIPLTLRFLIRVGGKTTTLKYHVVPHA